VNDPTVVNPVNGAANSLMFTWGDTTGYYATRELSNMDLLQRYLGGVSNKGVWTCPANIDMWNTKTPSSTTSIFANRVLGYSYLLNNFKRTSTVTNGAPDTTSSTPDFLFGSYTSADTADQKTPKKISQIFACVGAPIDALGDHITTRDSTKLWLITDLDGRNWDQGLSGTFGIVPSDTGTIALKNARGYQPVHRINKKLPAPTTGSGSGLGRIYGFLDGHAEFLLYSAWPNNDPNS
jgi:hypothetical protein